MQKSVDIVKRERITNPRLLDWNVVASQWEWSEEKQKYVSIEYHFTDDLKWEKQIVTRNNIDNQ